jgi:hypothetical protein
LCDEETSLESRIFFFKTYTTAEHISVARVNHQTLQFTMASTEPPQSPVGPDYVSSKRKPVATVSTTVNYDNVHVLQQTPQLIALLTCVSRKVSEGCRD